MTKIEKVETFLWSRWLLIKIHSEDGIVGIGEGGVHGWQRPTKTMVDVMTEYLIGKDPNLIEHHYQYLYRSSHFMGSVVQGALSAIDIALWDMKGKRLGVPIYDLMGGKTRDRVRCYMHVNGDTGEELAADALRAKQQGFTAVRFTPFPRDYYLHKSYTEWADEAVERVGMVKDSVGSDVDICVEIHRQMNPAESIWLGRRLEQFNPFFYEDPMLPDSPRANGGSSSAVQHPDCHWRTLHHDFRVPTALGERWLCLRAPRPLPLWRSERLQKSCRHGRSTTCQSHSTQSPVAHLDRRVRSTRCMHPELRVARIHRRIRATQV